MNNQNKVTDLYAPPQAITTIEQQQAVPLSYLGTTGRIGRLRYIAWTAGGYLLFIIGLSTLSSFTEVIRGAVDDIIPSAIVGLIFIAGIIFLWSFVIRCTMQRLQDFDYNKWLALLLFVPFINILLSLVCLIVPGSIENNKYGPPPPPNSGGVIILVVVSLIFFLCSLLVYFFSVV